MALLDLPTDANLDELAQWWAEHFAEIKQLRSFLYVTSKRLTEYVRDAGPVRTEHGLLQILREGWDWDAELIREIMPALLTGGAVKFTDDKIEHIERVLSLVLEEFPEIAYEVTWSVDKGAAAGVIKAGGEAGEKLLEARKPQGSLGVR